ncbi:MAG TPA: Crp/Fnr family transcriptional regulator [Tissierellia bacterium]|nr:Crp/Fnr family transcriptional regulator [Tissierellia bacterium]
MLQVLAQIRQLDLLKDLDEEAVYKYLLEGSFSFTRYGVGNMVHFAGEQATKLEIILSGEVVIERIDENGDLMVITQFGEGDFIGGNLLFSSQAYYPLTISTTRPTTILEIHRDHLFHLLSSNADFLRRYLEYVSDHSVVLSDQINHYVNRTIREAVLSFLEYESQRQESNTIVLDMTKKELAHRFGVRRTSLQRELAKMRDEGMIRFDAETITILEG